MSIIVIGGGIAGCAIARMLAERDQQVHIYEQSSGVGGVLKTLQTLAIDSGDHVPCTWLMSRAPFQQDGSRLVPRCPPANLCEHLAAHKGISVMKHVKIIDVLQARRASAHVVSTASPDALVGMRYGMLPWHEGRPVRNPMSLSAYWQYTQLLAQEGIMWCGSLASFEVLSIPQILRQCMAVTDAITPPPTTRPMVPLSS